MKADFSVNLITGKAIRGEPSREILEHDRAIAHVHVTVFSEHRLISLVMVELRRACVLFVQERESDASCCVHLIEYPVSIDNTAV